MLGRRPGAISPSVLLLRCCWLTPLLLLLLLLLLLRCCWLMPLLLLLLLSLCWRALTCATPFVHFARVCFGHVSTLIGLRCRL